MEGAGEDPYLGSLIAKARIQGFQGDDLAAPNTIAACAKHFAAYGFAEAGRDYNTADIGTNTLYNQVFPPFQAALEAEVATVMNSFNVLNHIPATGDAWLQRDILKGRWEFPGLIVSDWGSCLEMVAHGYSEDLEQATVQAVNAGMDIDMESYAVVNHLANAVKNGDVDESTIDEAVRRILKLKFELGLMDDPYLYCDLAREEAEVYSPAQMEAALNMAKRSMVLLKNEGDLLPLSAEEDILVIGDLADDKTSILGSWRISSEDETAVSVMEGMTKMDEDIAYERGVELYNGRVDFAFHINVNQDDFKGFDPAVERARRADKVVMVLGEHGFQSGEGRSRTDLGLPGLQQELLEAVYAVNKNIVLVLLNGRPLVIPWAAENIPSILEAWQPGTRGGDAIAEVLYGQYNPSGKLPMTFPRDVGQIPIYYNALNTGRPGPSDVVFWSHYADMPNSPQWPFGYGLSYTTFEYADQLISELGWLLQLLRVSIVLLNTS
jgi:beta-glucosidase